MIKIDLLKNYPDAIPTLAHVWHEVLGKIWFPELTIGEIESLTYDELNHPDETISFVALCYEIPVGFCTFKLKEEFRPDLGPWLSDVVVDPKYQNQGIGKMLIDATLLKAKELGFEKLYLFAFDPTIPEYYERLGCKKIGMDEFKSHPVTVMEVTL
ncbi:GNAT family N-acetyltransferase [Candidatus Trichorickettsia mobilis]|uniref:GNAT family N-acetyltransferase n=1 Tax=Candidatus Trichorickettsia mobilis TaxID=1346319 RepID=A0ABZ0UUF0_9RICK|nr:GNAT family N-acetyltransferase [Candidatus Trichorickettsia mobilis]WPY00717.1 GNAT family N-acetyltransferase [Candidatus Trichorickettsia mobilis]